MARFPKPLGRDPDAAADAEDGAPRARRDELGRVASAAAGGDPDAAATLVAHVGGSMLMVIRKVMGRASADVDDVAQDAVIALLGSLASFRGDCSVAHFAHRIALLTALAARRRTRLRAQAVELADEPVDELPDGGACSPLAAALAARRRTLVRGLLDELPEVIAEALALHFILGYTVDEIAAAGAVSPNTVWSRLRLGKQALRRKLDRDRRLAELLREPT
jgi:RNA polymerase sigma-70 factor (ECF subfamily)